MMHAVIRRLSVGRVRRSPLRSSLLAAAVAAVTAVTLSGCGSEAPATTPAPGVARKDCGTLTLAVNPWAGYEANVAVVSYLARTKLRCEVVLKREAEVDSWKHMATGDVDAILENWGHDDLKKKYIDEEKAVVEAGLTGNQGVIGWYVPGWLAQEHPDIRDWHNLNKYKDLFRTAKSGSKGQLLDGDPTYVTNDAALVRNLGLDFTVVFAGSEEALNKAFRDAQRNREPLLGYFYSPQWLLTEVDLVHISLPAYTPGCDADPKTVKCDYQPYDLDKVANKKFAYSGSPAFDLIKNFKWTDDDQNQVARDIASKGMTPDQAAKRWLDENEDTWSSWLPADT
jgi:glycine betaine/proline transport system substrate-binding protein